jgi:bla regulator protein BlaR1
MAGSFFIHFIVTALAASAAILLILLVKKVLKKHISMRWQYNLDVLFLILLAVLFIPGGLLGFFNTGNWLNTLGFGGNTAANVGTAAGEGTAAMYGTGWLQDFSVSVNRSAPGYLPTIFMGIWIVGIIAFAVVTIVCNRNLRLIKESVKPVEDAEILSVFARCKAELGIKQNVFFGTSVLVKTPLTVGIIKTRIILPAECI